MGRVYHTNYTRKILHMGVKLGSHVTWAKRKVIFIIKKRLKYIFSYKIEKNEFHFCEMKNHLLIVLIKLQYVIFWPGARSGIIFNPQKFSRRFRFVQILLGRKIWNIIILQEQKMIEYFYRNQIQTLVWWVYLSITCQ